MQDNNALRTTSSSPQSLSWFKNLIYGLASFVLVFAVVGCVGEIAMRLLPLGRYRSAPFRQYDPVLGISLIPNMKVVHSRGCFTGLVETNNWGFRDRARTLEKPPGTFRIALLGDSIVEAVHVQPQQVMNIQMEKLLQQQGYNNIEVMDFAVEGIGTTQEMIMYKERVRQFHPDLVIVVFSDNDILNNSRTLQDKEYGIHTWYAPYYDLGADGNLVFRPVESRWFNGLRTYLERHSVLVYYLERTWLKFDPMVYNWRGVDVSFGTYSTDPLDPEWAQAWQVTEKLMAMMRRDVESDGAKFLVIAQANPFTIVPDWRPWIMEKAHKIPPGFDPPKFYERLNDITAKAGVHLESIVPYMLAYRDEHHLQSPYFSLPCDSHYSALGHRAVAEAIVQILEKDHLIPPAPVAAVTP
ncbi:MAG: SGNH/GDSL hydrolase family protein [Terriglobales bacterium]